MIKKLLWLVVLLAPPAFSQSTGTIAQGQVVRSCTAVTAPTAALPGTVGGCTALALLTSGGVLPNTYTFEVTGGTATLMGSVDGSSWTTLGSATNTTQTFGGAFRWLGCVPTSVSGSLNCNVSVTVGNGGGGGGGSSSVHINGTPAAQPNFNATTPPPPANSAPVVFQTDANDNVSAAIEGNGNSDDCFHGDGIFKPCGVTSIDSLTGAFNFTGAVTCTAGTPNVCNFTGGTGGVGTGVVGQYAIYDTTSSITGTPTLTTNGSAVTSTVPLSFSPLGPGGLTPTPIPGTTVLSTATNGGLILSQNGGTFAMFRPIAVNSINAIGGINNGGTAINFNGTNANPPVCSPAAPTNGRCITFQQTGISVSGSLVGDGSTNCLSGQGTYVPCGTGSGGSGTVGAGLLGQFAFYSANGNAVVGSPNLIDSNGIIAAAEPFAAPTRIFPVQSTLTPVAGENILAANAAGNLVYSNNGGAFAPIAGGSTAISALTPATATNTIANGDFGQVWQWSLATAGNTGLNISESAPSTATGSSLVKISQPTSGSQAVALTIQSGAASAAVNALQIQNSSLSNTLTISNGGTISTSGNYQSFLTAGTAQLCGGNGNCTISNSATAGGARVRGSDNSANSANSSGGFAIIAAGANTSTAPLASQVNNVTQLASPFYCTGLCTLTTVMCSAGALDQVTACATTPQSAVLGISEGTGAGTSVWVASAGTAQVRVDNTAVVGDTLCTSTTTAGSATDSGGTDGCATGQQIGVVMAVSGTTGIPNGVSNTSVTFSTSAPKVALTGRSASGGGSGTVGAGTANQFAIYNGTNSIIGSPALTATGGQINIPSSLQIGSTSFLFLNNQSMTSSGTTLTTVPTFGGFGVNTGAVPSISVNGAAWQPVPYVTVNGTNPTVNLAAFGTTPAAPANGRNVTWQRNTTGQISAALVGDGSLNCLSGQGTYVACSGGTGGVSGSGTTGFIPAFTAATTIGNSHINDGVTTAGTITATEPLTINASNPALNLTVGSDTVNLSVDPTTGGLSTGASGVLAPSFTTLTAPGSTFTGSKISSAGAALTPTAGQGGIGIGAGGIPEISVNGGAYVPIPTSTSGGGVSGSGTVGFFPIFTNTTVLGNGPISAVFSPPGTVNNINVVQANGLPISPSVSAGIGFITGMEMEVTSAAANCGGTVSISPNGGTSPGCTGQHIYFSQNDATSAGVNTALFAQNIGSATGAPNGVLDMGVMGSVTTQVPTAEERAGYFEANDANFGNVVTTTRRGVMGVAINATTRTTALNEGVVAQTGAPSSVNTQDYSMHCLTPSSGNSTSMPTHACLKIEPQGTGVELQTGAHTFSNLPACSTAYEGSMAAITDGSATSGTVTGGGTNHVLIYCNGLNWTAAAGGGGGTTTGPLICTSTTGVGFSNSGGNQTLCTFTLAPSHNYLVRCVYSLSFGTQSTSAVSDVDVGIHVVNGPANLSFFRGTFTDPSKTFADQSSVSGVTGTAGNGGVPNSFNLMRAMNIGSSPPNTTTNQEGFAFTIDGTYNTSAAGDTLIFYVGASLAGSTGFVEPGYYCRLE